MDIDFRVPQELLDLHKDLTDRQTTDDDLIRDIASEVLEEKIRGYVDKQIIIVNPYFTNKLNQINDMINQIDVNTLGPDWDKFLDGLLEPNAKSTHGFGYPNPSGDTYVPDVSLDVVMRRYKGAMNDIIDVCEDAQGDSEELQYLIDVVKRERNSLKHQKAGARCDIETVDRVLAARKYMQNTIWNIIRD